MSSTAETETEVEQQVIAVGALRIRFLVTGEESKGSAAILQLAAPVGKG